MASEHESAVDFELALREGARRAAQTADGPNQPSTVAHDSLSHLRAGRLESRSPAPFKP
jgi:hypothetical protein